MNNDTRLGIAGANNDTRLQMNNDDNATSMILREWGIDAQMATAAQRIAAQERLQQLRGGQQMARQDDQQSFLQGQQGRQFTHQQSMQDDRQAQPRYFNDNSGGSAWDGQERQLRTQMGFLQRDLEGYNRIAGEMVPDPTDKYGRRLVPSARAQDAMKRIPTLQQQLQELQGIYRAMPIRPSTAPGVMGGAPQGTMPNGQPVYPSNMGNTGGQIDPATLQAAQGIIAQVKAQMAGADPATLRQTVIYELQAAGIDPTPLLQ
jgi:hypothetical protein